MLQAIMTDVAGYTQLVCLPVALNHQKETHMYQTQRLHISHAKQQPPQTIPIRSTCASHQQCSRQGVACPDSKMYKSHQGRAQSGSSNIGSKHTLGSSLEKASVRLLLKRAATLPKMECRSAWSSMGPSTCKQQQPCCHDLQVQAFAPIDLRTVNMLG